MRACLSRAARAARQCTRLASSPLQRPAASSSMGSLALRSSLLMAARGELQARRLSTAAAAASRSPAASAAAAEVAEPAAAEASTSYGAQQIQV